MTPTKRPKKGPVKRKPRPAKCSEPSSDSANPSVDSTDVAPKRGRGRPKKTSTKAPTKSKTVKTPTAPRQTKKKATPKSEPTKEPSHQPTNPPSQACQPEANQPITTTTTAPPTAAIITESPMDQSDQPQKDAKAASEKKSTFWFWPWRSASQTDSTLSNDSAPTVLMDAAHLSVEISKNPEEGQLEQTEQEIPKKPDESNPEQDEDTT